MLSRRWMVVAGRFGWAVLRRVLGLRPAPSPSPPSRMNEAEVRDLATAAFLAAGIGRDRPHPYGVIVTRPARGADPPVWVASTATIGSGWRVSVDDATAEVGRVTRWGLR